MPDIVYLAGRPMTMGDHDVQPGDEIDASQIPLLESFISAGYVYRVVGEEGYDRLPPHLFSTVHTRREAEQKIFATDGVTNTESAAAQEVWTESDVYRRAEAQATVSQGRNSPAAQAKAAAFLANSQKPGRKSGRTTEEGEAVMGKFEEQSAPPNTAQLDAHNNDADEAAEEQINEDAESLQQKTTELQQEAQEEQLALKQERLEKSGGSAVGDTRREFRQEGGKEDKAETEAQKDAQDEDKHPEPTPEEESEARQARQSTKQAEKKADEAKTSQPKAQDKK